MVTTDHQDCAVIAPAGTPPGLLEEFWRYDRALLAADRATLDALFPPGPHTLSADGSGPLSGHAALGPLRAAHGRVPTRRVVEVQVRPLGADAALVTARTRDGEADGSQTQVWQRGTAGRWLVAWQVTLPAAPSCATAPHSPTTAPHSPTATPHSPAETPPSSTETPPSAGKASASPSTTPHSSGEAAADSAPFDRTVWRAVGDPLVAARAPGPLDGVGIAVKDLFAVAGQPIGAGVAAWLAEQRPQTETAPALAELLDAGAHIVGIARTDEFAYSLTGANAHYGTPPNPAAPDRVSGGSTGGPAAAVALGQAAVGLGTDTAGSIRIPASYQGLVGLRSTHGSIDRDGVLPLARSFDAIGWLTEDVAASTAIARVLLGGPDGTGRPADRTLRLPTVEAMAAPEVVEAFSAVVERAAAAGLLPPVHGVDLPHAQLERWVEAFRTVQAWEAWQAHGCWLTAHPDALGPDVAGRFAQASRVSEDEAARALAVTAEAAGRLTELLSGAVLALPTAPGPAPSRAATGQQFETARAATLRMTCLAGLAGAPAVSLPLLRSADGLPVGLCLVGAPGSDLDLLTLAAGLETSPRPA
ncbi:amidase [Streptomyces sp. NPDC102462]|uniref:amidase n=1 Tax=Streptomyces sp. NPDC102462 TaxID=3366178 RepID=UPI0038164D14